VTIDKWRQDKIHHSSTPPLHELLVSQPASLTMEKPATRNPEHATSG